MAKGLSTNGRMRVNLARGGNGLWAMGAAPSRGWVAGRLWNPPPPPPWLAGWLTGWRAPEKQPKYVVHHCTASSHAWYGYGDGFAMVGGVGHLSRTPLPHTPSCLAFRTSHKDQEHKTWNHRIRRMFNCKCCRYGCKPQSTQLSSIRNIYHPYCNIYPKAPFQRTLTSPTPHADVSWTRGRYNTMQRQLCWVIVQLDH